MINKVLLVFLRVSVSLANKHLIEKVTIIINSTKTENGNDAIRHFIELIRSILELQNVIIDEQLTKLKSGGTNKTIVEDSNIYPNSMPLEL